MFDLSLGAFSMFGKFIQKKQEEDHDVLVVMTGIFGVEEVWEDYKTMTFQKSFIL